MLASVRRRAAMKIYGDTNSGNCLKVKWVCDKLALPYHWIAIDTLKGETRTPEFLKLNSAGQVPDGRTRRRPHAGAVQRHHPLSRPRQRPHSRRTPSPPRRWTNGCSGNSTATSPMSRYAASRWSISASRPPISIPTRSSAAMPRWRGWSTSSPHALPGRRRGFARRRVAAGLYAAGA